MNRFSTSILVLFSALVFLTSCGTTQQLTSSRKPAQIDSIFIMQPLTSIDVIPKKGKQFYDKESSDRAAVNVFESIERHIPKRIVKQYLEIDSTELFKIYDEIFKLTNQVEGKQSIENVPLSPEMMDLLTKNNFKFGIGSYCIGFIREKGQYGKEIAPAIVLGVLIIAAELLGGRYYGYYPHIPPKSISSVTCFIVDKSKKNIAFYRRNVTKGGEPISPKVIDEQVSDMLNAYFEKKR